MMVYIAQIQQQMQYSMYVPWSHACRAICNMQGLIPSNNIISGLLHTKAAAAANPQCAPLSLSLSAAGEDVSIGKLIFLLHN